MKNKKLLTNILFAAVVLAIAAVLLAVRSHSATDGKLAAQLIYGDNNAVLDIPLDKDETYSVDTGYYTVHIEVKAAARGLLNRPARITSARALAGCRRRIRPPPACPPAPC